MIKKFFRFLRRLPPSRALSKYAKQLRPWGFEGLSIYEVSVFFGRGLNRGGLKTRASSMAYNFFLAIFPSLIFLFTLIPFLPIHNFQDTLFNLISSAMPKNASAAMETEIKDILHTHHSKLLSIGFIAALYFSTQGIVAMMGAFNKSIHVKEKRMAWKQQLVAVLLVLVLSTLLLVSVSILIVTQYLIHKIFHHDSTQQILILAGQWLVVGALCMFVIGLFYRFGPSQRMHKNFLSPGVIAATILIILTSLLFAWYINNFSKYNKLYGSIGSILVLLIWIYYNSIMLIIGFELDAAIAGAKEKHLSILEQEEIEMKKEEETV